MPIVKPERPKILQWLSRPNVYGPIVGFIVIVGLVVVFQNPIDDFLYRIGVLHQDVSAVLAKADQQQRRSQFSQSITTLQQGLRRTANKSDESQFDITLASYYQVRGDNNNALKYYTDWQTLNPGNNVYAETIGDLLESMGRHADAVTYYKQAIMFYGQVTGDPVAKAEQANVETKLTAAEAGK